MSSDKTPISDFSISKALAFANQNFNEVVYLTSNSENDKEMLAFGEKTAFLAKKTFIFDDFQQFLNKTNEFKFGFFTYDIKNSIENLESNNEDRLNFPLAYFFSPKHLIVKENDGWKILTDDESILGRIKSFDHKEVSNKSSEVVFKDNISREEYINQVNQAKYHIKQGDVYELNFCYEKFAENAEVDPLKVFQVINKRSAAPFSSFLKLKNRYALCFSPERYLKKEGDKLISQPIKGTAKRGSTKEEDESIKEELRNNPKEQNENVMIVDLVRNDLSKTAAKNSVKVDELFGVYSFNTVYQMISTISSKLKEGTSISDTIETTFPMGSMTGAPKIRAMEIIENVEQTKRGLYSGAIGYITPNQDFDFNVVIRTLLYNSHKQYLSLMVGSAITDACNPEDEYEETLLKASKIVEYFN